MCFGLDLCSKGIFISAHSQMSEEDTVEEDGGGGVKQGHRASCCYEYNVCL